MGKGNRVRNERAETSLATVGTAKAPAKKNKGLPSWVITAIVIGVLLLVVCFVAYNCMEEGGVFMRMTTVVETENFEVNVPMMSYMIANQRDYLVNMYSQWGSGIQIGSGTGGTPLNTSVALKDQNYSVTTDPVTGETVTKTWLEYFYDQALEQVIEVLACCEEAKNLELELSDEDYENIKLQLDSVENYGALYGYSSNATFAMFYGTGVTRGDVEDMLELMQLASIYTNYKTDGYNEAIKNNTDRINSYYEEHKSDYETYIDYVGYTFTASFKPSTNKDETKAKEENEKLAAEYKAQQEKYKGYMDQLAECKDANEFLNKLYELVLQDEKDKIVAAKDDYDSIDDLTEDEVKKCDEAARNAQEKATVINYSKPAGALTGIDAWLFETKTEGEGDNKVTTDVRVKGEVGKKDDAHDVVTTGDNAYKAVSSKYGAAVMLRTKHRNDDLVRSVGHILFKAETFDGKTSTDHLPDGEIKTMADKVLSRDGVLSAEAMAKELIETMKAEGHVSQKTKEDGTAYDHFASQDMFETYGNNYTGDSKVLYNGVKKGQMVDGFDNWLFDSTRVEGELSYVKTEYGYHVMYYVGDECESWYFTIRNTLAASDLEADIKAAIEKHKNVENGGSMEIADKFDIMDDMKL